MAKPKLHVYIPSLPQRSYEYRRGDSIVIYDDDKNAVLIDGGERELFDRMETFLKKSLKRSDGYAHVTFVLTHWHGDHDCGLRYALESSHIFIDEIYAPDPAELKLVPRDDGYDEYSRAVKRIALAKQYNKKITYPTPERRVGHWVGKIRMWMWRQKASNKDYVDYQVNNTSIQVYFPDLEFLTTGDAITSEAKFLKAYDWPIVGFKIPHHGNAAPYSTCDLLTEHGAKICYYTDWEPNGVGIGNTTFSKYGAGRTKQYFTTLRPFEDITIDADGMGHVVWTQGKNAWNFPIAYGSDEVLPAPDPDAETDVVVHANKGFKGYNVSKRTDAIKYIVVHYVGAESTAKDNVSYFNAADRKASADYFVGHDGDIWQYNPNIKSQYSWHCGGAIESSHHPLHGICTNGNSIGVELCTKKAGSDWTFTDKTVESAALLVRYLMREYNVDADHVCRHYDVTGKACPRVSGWGAVGGDAEWKKFQKAIGAVKPEAAQIYRVRKSWSDAASQLGAFSNLDNAKAMAAKHEGFHVYDKDGTEIN